jgi:enoyl-CoA hydratase/carnithine racemase
MELKVVEYERNGPVAVVTLNRPHRLNAWTGRMHTEYRWCLDQAASDDDVRVVVVTGAGDGFCAGADAKALSGHADRGGYDAGIDEATIARPGYGVAPEFDADFAYHFGLDKPIIAAINGPAAGVGLVLACFCDLRFAVPGAKLTTAHGKLNLPAEYGLSWLLPRLIGTSRAMDMMLSSRVVLAEEAHAWGLVNKLAAPDEVLEMTVSYASDLAASVSRGSLASTRHQIYRDLHRDAATSVRDSAERMDQMMGEPDFARGVEALHDKRSPDFR